MSVLEVRNVSIRFGGLAALSGLDITVNEFEIVGLIGPNGAGKTTAFNCITGFYRADTGSVTYRGRDVTRMPPHKKAAIGFGRTFQNVGMVKSATALDNLKTAQHVHAGYSAGAGVLGLGQARTRESALTERAEQILDMLKLSDIRDRRVGGLPYGVLKLLEVGCALATDPDVLLLDEPSSGMGPEEAHELGDRLLNLRRELGLTMLLIEHHVPLVTAVCDYVYVLNFGRLLAEGEPSLIRTHPEVVAAYLGGEAPSALEATTEPAEDAALESELAAEVADVVPLAEQPSRARSARVRRTRVRAIPADEAAPPAEEVRVDQPAEAAAETVEFPAIAGEEAESGAVVTLRPRRPATRTPGQPVAPSAGRSVAPAPRQAAVRAPRRAAPAAATAEGSDGLATAAPGPRKAGSTVAARRSTAVPVKAAPTGSRSKRVPS